MLRVGSGVESTGSNLIKYIQATWDAPEMSGLSALAPFTVFLSNNFMGVGVQLMVMTSVF